MQHPHPHRIRRSLVLVAVLTAGAAAVSAQTFKDPALEALYVADKSDELQRISAQRVAAQADDAQAVLGLALAALEREDAAARQQAIARAQACIDKQPRAAPCQYALGAVLGIQAASEGMMKMARSAGTVREALTAAHEIDPAWYPARSALCEFHLLAPGLMGGSTSKAAELARTAPQPEQVKALQARAALADRKFEPALSALAALPAGLDAALAADAVGWAAQAGLGMVNAGQAEKAALPLEQLQRSYPREAAIAYALGRVRGEAGAHAEALKLYEQASGLRGAAAWPLLYRVGVEQQALGRAGDARASFKRYVAAGKGPKNLIEEAKKRLEQLGA